MGESDEAVAVEQSAIDVVAGFVGAIDGVRRDPVALNWAVAEIDVILGWLTYASGLDSVIDFGSGALVPEVMGQGVVALDGEILDWIYLVEN